MVKNEEASGASAKPLRCAAYLRVSSDQQSTANQRPEISALMKARGWEATKVYEETCSTKKSRPVFEKMIADAHAGRFDVLVIWAIDRLGRSMAGNLSTVLALDEIGVKVVSVREAWLDTVGPVRSLLVAIFSWVAETERNRLGERVRAGLDRARKDGKKLGRPRVSVDLAKAQALRDAGQSLRQVAGC